MREALEVPWGGCLQSQWHFLLAADFLVLSATQPLYAEGKLGNESQTPLRSAGCRVALFCWQAGHVQSDFFLLPNFQIFCLRTAVQSPDPGSAQCDPHVAVERVALLLQRQPSPSAGVCSSAGRAVEGAGSAATARLRRETRWVCATSSEWKGTGSEEGGTGGGRRWEKMVGGQVAGEQRRRCAGSRLSYSQCCTLSPSPTPCGQVWPTQHLPFHAQTSCCQI